MLFTFGLLFAATATAWLQPVRIGPRLSIPAWQALLGAAIVAGLIQGFLSAPALVALGLLAALAVGAERAANTLARAAAGGRHAGDAGPRPACGARLP